MGDEENVSEVPEVEQNFISGLSAIKIKIKKVKFADLFFLVCKFSVIWSKSHKLRLPMYTYPAT